ncbi:restriction endonuclease subunit S [Chryseobacterium sp. HMWF035]|uniref:restriction endonuclease subunit S n=2 Tax=unclassified Chryseobacterium TaxID=2593645 RepID=UPI000D574DFC|nr:restriction endonuclease subunit S [Chryseobacterium sp. HMWF035]PVV55320.1 hypothetical protein DD829_14965 [Chryseobacterium sp. HMWF035]
MDIKYFPITFITEKSDIENQISNSVVFAELFKTNQTTNLKYYLESTQYGYTASALPGGTHKLVRITDIKANGVDWDSVPFCNCENDKKFLLKKNDILITRTGGTVGKSFIVKDCPEKSVYASYLIRLRLNEKAKIDFINMFLNSYLFWNQIFDLKSGAAIPNVNAEKLKEIKIPLCTLEEQVEILSNKLFFEKKNRVNILYNLSYQNSIELNNQSEIIKNLRQAFLREAMQGKLVNNETSDGKTGVDLLLEIQTEKEKLIKEKKIKKSKPLPPISDDEIPFEIPENWTWCRLGELIDLVSGASFSSNSFAKNEGVKCIKITNAGVNEFIETDEYLPKDFLEKYTSNVVYHNDLILALTRPYISKGLKISKCPLSYDRSLLNQRVAALRVNNRLNNDFVFFVMKSDFILNIYKSKFKGIGQQPNLKNDDVNFLTFPLPPLDIQNRIVSKLNELMKHCDDLERSVIESQNYNEQLLQQVLREALEGKDEVENENLKLVAEDSPMYSVSKDIQKNCDTGDMAILAGYIIKKLSTQNSKDFGRVKLQKMLHLVEYHCQLSSELKYQKNVAGPHAWELEHVIEPKLKSLRFFEIKKDKFGATSKVTYTPLSASNELTSLFNREFKDQAESINNLLNKFQDKTWEFCERISTMYAVWNNRLIRKELFTDEILKQDFLAWDDKKKRFIDVLDHTLEWIRKEKIEPVGFGEYIDKK